jgi:hypothetical protein
MYVIYCFSTALCWLCGHMVITSKMNSFLYLHHLLRAIVSVYIYIYICVCVYVCVYVLWSLFIPSPLSSLSSYLLILSILMFQFVPWNIIDHSHQFHLYLHQENLDCLYSTVLPTINYSAHSSHSTGPSHIVWLGGQINCIAPHSNL